MIGKWYIYHHHYHLGYIDGSFNFLVAINDVKVVYAALKHTFNDVDWINLA